ncbi:hypothetical protein [Methylobacterium sp. MA0201]|uniref:hypothetical protein n=1 Tax=Methylobacterium alsaeris TaxID=3344826 RepID=UPI003757BFBD
MAALTLWSELGGRPLKPEEMDANFVALRDMVEGMVALGAFEGIASIDWDSDAGTVTVNTTRGRSLGPFQLPAKPIRLKGSWQSGAGYAPGDLFLVDKTVLPDAPGAYLTLTAHVAGAAAPANGRAAKGIANDIGLGLAALIVPAGKDALTFRGLYDASLKYNLNDQVVSIENGLFYYWQLYYDAPAGTAPGASIQMTSGGQTYQIGAWARVAVGNTYGSKVVFDAGRGKALDVLIADLYDKIGKLQTLAVSNNSRLNTTGDPTHPYSYTPFSTAP